MKVNSIGINNYYGIKKQKVKNSAQNPIIKEQNYSSKQNTPYYNLNFTGGFEAVNKKKFADNQELFTPEAQDVWAIANAAAKATKTQVGHYHLLYASLYTINKYIEELDKGVRKDEENTSFKMAYTLESLTGVAGLLKNEEKRAKVKKINQGYLKTLADRISELPKIKPLTPKVSTTSMVDLNSIYDTVSNALDTDSFTDNVFFLSAYNGRNPKAKELANRYIYELQQAVMIDDKPTKEKYHLGFYDDKADKIWKSLNLGNDVYLTYEGENKEAAEHLVSSFTNLINKPGQKYSNLNKDNTQIVLFGKDAIFEVITKKAEEARKDSSKTYVFIVDMTSALLNTALAEGQSTPTLLTEDLEFLENKGKKGIPSNIRIILISNKNVLYANTQAQSPLRKYLEHYGEFSIPLINAQEAQDILIGPQGKRYIKGKIQKDFDDEATRYIVSSTSQSDGYYPEKALRYMQKLSAYYADKEKITVDDIKAYEAENTEAKKTGETQEDFKIIFDTGKTLDDIIGNPMTKAEAKSVVSLIQSGKRGLTRGYTTFLDNGTSYGGGRRHTAEAIAGEAKIPMIVINARDFALKDIDALAQNSSLSEIKIKKLISAALNQAETSKNKAAMIFIENFDNFGSDPLYGISSIYEQKAFSQLLSEMENVRKNKGVNLIIVGSTNRPELLDENIMKPYKFLDKIIIYSPQDERDRIDILNYYVSKNGLKIKGDTQEEKDEVIRNIAQTTNYFSVVDLMYLLDKADDISKERGKDEIDKSDFTEAFLQTTTGRVSSRETTMFNNELVASHECGHGLALQIMYNIAKKEQKPWHLPDQVNFITLDPRGNYGGAMFPKKSKNDQMSFETVFSELVCDFGGHASENRFYNMEGSWGITQDMQMATDMAKAAVQIMGMGPKTGRISIRPNHLGALDISDTLRERIDSDVEVLLRNSEHCADRIVEVYSDFIEQFSQKYAPKVGTGECIITSEQFNKELEAWKKDLGDEKLKELDELEREILEVIQKTKQGKLAKE